MQKQTRCARLIAIYSRSEDLIRIGAYQKNSDPTLDRAIENMPAIESFLRQKPVEFYGFDETIGQLVALPA